jgi:carbon storage regulator
MLVLSRKESESIVINGSITIVVAEIRGNRVRLAVKAPKDVPVHRKEVHARLNMKKAVENHNSIDGGRT